MRIFIMHTVQDKYYVRNLQLLLENNPDERVTTYTFELNQTITHKDFFLSSINLEAVTLELSHCDVIIMISSSPFHRALETLFRDSFIRLFNEEMFHGKQMTVIDIDDCIGLDGKELQARLKICVNKARSNFGNELFWRLFSQKEMIQTAKYLVNRMGDPSIRDALLDNLKLTQGTIEIAITYVRNILKIEWSDAQHKFYSDIIEEFFPQTPQDFTPKSKRLFLSHSVRDLPIIRIAQILFHRLGYHSQMFRLAMLEDINNREKMIELFSVLRDEVTTVHTDAVIIFNSRNFRKSAWTLIEMAIAIHNEKPMYEFDIDNIIETHDDEEKFDMIGDQVSNFAESDSYRFMPKLISKSPSTVKSLPEYDDLWIVAEIVRILSIHDELSQISAFAELRADTESKILSSISFLADNGRLSDDNQKKINRLMEK